MSTNAEDGQDRTVATKDTESVRLRRRIAHSVSRVPIVREKIGVAQRVAEGPARRKEVRSAEVVINVPGQALQRVPQAVNEDQQGVTQRRMTSQSQRNKLR